MKQKLVSIIIPTFNCEDFLIDCLESVRKQTYKNIEVIIVDSFSTDSTPQLAKKYGKVFSFGRNTYGQLGDATNHDRLYPSSILLQRTPAVHISAFEEHSMMILGGGKAYNFGHNGNGQLGNGDTSHQYTPKLIETYHNLSVIQIEGGRRFSVMILSNYSCFGKISSDNSICSNNGICVEENLCKCAYNAFGNQCQFTTCFGINSSSPNVCSGNGYCKHTDICICNNGYDGATCESYLNGTKTFSCGLNTYGQRGDGSVEDATVPTPLISDGDGIIKLFAGTFNSFIIKNGSKAFGIGRNNRGQLADGHFGINTQTSPSLVDFQNFDIESVAIGYEHILFLKKDGTVHSVGDNGYGQLGLGFNSDRNVNPLPLVEFNVNIDRKSVV